MARRHHSTVARRWRGLSAMVVLWLWAASPAVAQPPTAEPAAPESIPQERLTAAIGQLGNLDFPTRTAASRLVRRTPGSQAVPALLRAVAEHADGYVRYRALVLLTGFNDPRTRDAMRESMTSPNDRLRTVAYSYFEHNPDPAFVPDLLAATVPIHACSAPWFVTSTAGKTCSAVP
jgi:HEAT repeat protein